jgi:hypothetical protein
MIEFLFMSEDGRCFEMHKVPESIRSVLCIKHIQCFVLLYAVAPLG